jgi:hypothetical protein
MAKPTSSKTAPKTASKTASKGKKTTTAAAPTSTTPVARPAIGKDDKALEEEAEAVPAHVAGKKRKSTSSSSTGLAKDPEHDPETIKNTQKNSKTHTLAPKDAGKITPGVSLRSSDDKDVEGASGKPNKRAKVHVNKPAVTEEKTIEDVPLPTVASSSSTGGKKSKKTASKKDDEETASIPASASKPASSLKSALKSNSKKTTPDESDDFIHGFSSSDGEGDGEESVDEDDSDVDMDADAGVKKVVAKDLPKVVQGDKVVEEKLLKAKRKGVSLDSFPRVFFSFLFFTWHRIILYRITLRRRSLALTLTPIFHFFILFIFDIDQLPLRRAKRRESSTWGGSLMGSTKRR